MSRFRWGPLLSSVIVLALFPTDVVSGPFVFTDHPIAQTASYYETMPRFGNDGVSDLVVFPRRAYLSSGYLGPGVIWYQRIDRAGNPTGDAVQVSSGDPETDFELNDVSGDYIVYAAYDSVTVASGEIVVYRISTTARQSLRRADVSRMRTTSWDMMSWQKPTVVRRSGLPIAMT